LVRLAFRLAHGIELPAHDTVGPSPAEVADACVGEAETGPWEPVPLRLARAWDVLLAPGPNAALAGHVGVVVRPGELLNALRGLPSCLTPYDRRTGHPFEGAVAYRHRALAGRPQGA
jgi:hypothetical protein